ncbi:hypothetical protein [Catellatospora tritici]|uniref:hypothetical protein n=1 Tax=Catellatospora tritici TaxID=2851566 RepID=UPI001C2D9A5D|nr:hypothetical protein [Catellatospora tritici]MBV1852975.1 hypothetical protein [Catellatospora tritici]
MARRWVDRGEPASRLAVTVVAARAAALTTGCLRVWPTDGLAWLLPGTILGLAAALCLRLPAAPRPRGSGHRSAADFTPSGHPVDPARRATTPNTSLDRLAAIVRGWRTSTGRCRGV